MTHSLKKLVIVSWMMIALALSPLVAYAQNSPDYGPNPSQTPSSNTQQDTNGAGGYSPSGTGQEVFCRGDRDFTTFLSSAISYDGFSEYWKDILVRYNTNICQYQDIESLLKQITKVREELRQAFYVCADTRQLKDTYYKLEAELFFLRKYIDTDNGTFKQTNEQELFKDFRDFFVVNKGYFSNEQVKELFDQFKQKYTQRLTTYRNCKDVTWKNLVDKWQEFKDTVMGFGPAIEEASQSIAKKWDRMERTPLNEGRSFIGGFVDARINGLTPSEGWDQIAAEFEKNKPEGVSFEEFQIAKDASDARFQEELLEVDYLVQYQTLYAETSDEFTKDIVARLSLLNQVIIKTLPFQNQTIQCVKSVNDKQC